MKSWALIELKLGRVGYHDGFIEGHHDGCKGNWQMGVRKRENGKKGKIKMSRIELN
jgi:hypothetical protein